MKLSVSILVYNHKKIRKLLKKLRNSQKKKNIVQNNFSMATFVLALFIYLSTYLPTCLPPAYLPSCLPMYLSIYLSSYLGKGRVRSNKKMRACEKYFDKKR